MDSNDFFVDNFTAFHVSWEKYIFLLKTVYVSLVYLEFMMLQDIGCEK